MVDVLDLAGISNAALRESFELCERVHREANPITHHLISSYLPAQKHPYAHALYAFFSTTDEIADEGDPATQGLAFGEWTDAVLHDIEAGRSDHPLRRAFIHTWATWGLSTTLIAEFLFATTRDSERSPRFDTFDELRVFLRGVGGTPARLLLPLLEPTAPTAAADRLMSLLGEVFQLVDIFQDLPVDLVRGRCYLPLAELARFGLRPDTLSPGDRSGDLDGLVEHQVARARRMTAEGSAVVDLVHPSSRPFLDAAIAGCHLYLDHLDRLGSRMFTSRVDVVPPPRQRTSTELPPAPRRTAAGPSPIPPDRMPRHVAVIMDGNGRWARRRGQPRGAGHAAGERVVLDCLDGALELGLRYLSVFVFSTENWSRPSDEVTELLDLVARVLHGIVDRLCRQGVRLRWAGRRDRVPANLRAELEEAELRTSDNDGLTVILCLDYGARTEIVQAAGRLARDVAAGRVDVDAIEEQDFARYLYLPDVPEVDLLIRTSGEQRISNFLLWQAAYAELVFLDVLWPDADRHHLRRAVEAYASRERRFGSAPPMASVVRVDMR